MSKSPLFGRRIHIAGSISKDPEVAPSGEVERSREFVRQLVPELLQRGANFVLPVDTEPRRPADQLPICFDWLVWSTIADHLSLRPSGTPDPLVIAVQHHKNEEQIPDEFIPLWDEFRDTHRVYIENVSHWNMNSKRMEAQALSGDVLIALGGDEGVLYLANLYHDAGKPVIPLNFEITPPDRGTRRLFELGLSRFNAHRLFHVDSLSAHAWINRINFTRRRTVSDCVAGVVALLEGLAPPRAFVVRLLDPKHDDFTDVDNHFSSVVQPILEGELGYRMTTIDGRNPYEHAHIDQEIFSKLHRSSVVIADITGKRPNCFLELGYALGRGLPTILMAKDGSYRPFDVTMYASLLWNASESVEARRKAFREHWDSVKTRPPLVPVEPLIP